MAAEALPDLSLQVEPNPKDPSRYRWVIRDQDHILRQCLYSLPNEQAAHSRGEAAFEEMTALRRDAQ